MFVILLAAVLTAAGAMVAMVVRKETFYGAVGLFILCGPCSLLACLYMAVA